MAGYSALVKHVVQKTSQKCSSLPVHSVRDAHKSYGKKIDSSNLKRTSH